MDIKGTKPNRDSGKNPSVVLERDDLPALWSALRKRGYEIVGPTRRDGAIVYDELRDPGDLPVGWTDEQDGGSYRLKERSDAAVFGYVVGPHSWKKYLFPPAQRLLQAHREGDGRGMRFEPEPVHKKKRAFIGVRACELHAIRIQDRVFLGGPHVDESYHARRVDTFIVAVNCGQAGATCFCDSMNTGPKAGPGYDLALTEVLDAERHFFVVDTGSAPGAEVLKELPHRPAGDSECAAARERVGSAISQMRRSVDTANLKELLLGNLEHPRWEDVADRCLACANCTMVCPTCFCSNVEDVTDLTGDHAERWRKWDSCFTVDFSHIAGGSVRSSVKSRYRQWLTHKLATWIDQFGSSGCVGCGRCITWCPVGIDLTEEVRFLRETDRRRQPAPVTSPASDTQAT